MGLSFSLIGRGPGLRPKEISSTSGSRFSEFFQSLERWQERFDDDRIGYRLAVIEGLLEATSEDPDIIPGTPADEQRAEEIAFLKPAYEFLREDRVNRTVHLRGGW